MKSAIVSVLGSISIVVLVAFVAQAASMQRPAVVATEIDVPIRSSFVDVVPAVKPGQVIVHRHLYLAAIDTDAKQPAWVAYSVRRRDWDTETVLDRNFNTPAELRDICLEQSDFDGSGYDLGHLYGLQFVSASTNAAEVNQLCAIAAQRPDLNRGAWLAAENRVKELSRSAEVKVVAGLLWLDPMPALPAADESHRVASHCWMLISVDGSREAYLFPQSASLRAALSDFRVPPDVLMRKVAETWWKLSRKVGP